MRNRLSTHLMAGVLSLLCNFAIAENCVVPQEFWDRPRSGERVVALASIKPCVMPILNEQGQLVLHHRNNDEATLHAEELQGWLAALALDPARMSLRGDLQNEDELIIERVGTQ